MSSIDDPSNLKGMLNILVSDKDINLDELEKSILDGTPSNKQDAVDVVEDYNREIENIMSGITGPKSHYEDEPPSRKMVIPTNDEEEEDDPMATLDDDYQPVSNIQQQANSQQPSQQYGGGQRPDSYHAIPTRDPYLNNMTDEQRKQQHISSVLSSMDNKTKDDTIFLQQEDEEDEMVRMLEQIDLLKSNLEAEGVDISRIPEITATSSPKEASRILKILQIKNDRSRYCDMFEEGILAVAYGVENMFDGKKEWFGTKIDLVGWPETVKVKLRRMRYDTSSFVSEVMKGYSISHGWRIIFELLPSLFLYSRQRRTNTNDNLTTDKQYQEAMQSLAS